MTQLVRVSAAGLPHDAAIPDVHPRVVAPLPPDLGTVTIYFHASAQQLRQWQFGTTYRHGTLVAWAQGRTSLQVLAAGLFNSLAPQYEPR
jgi:hypothetical protein